MPIRVAPALLSCLLFSCTATPKAPCVDTQRVVESVAVLHPECLRLSVHSVPPGGGSRVAIASTDPERLGRPSDPEDLEAMRSGQTIVLDEPGALDVTVPITRRGNVWAAACGVTMRVDAATDRAQLRARAEQIAKSIEAAMLAKAPGAMPR